MSSFKDVVGHKNIIKYISSAVQADAVSHAYILNGERGSGKRLLANLFAMSLQCQNRAEDGEACGKCQSCKQAQSGNQPDIIKVTHEKPNTISVDDIRTQINNDIVIKPYSSKYKIYIIPEADLMSAQAQNALLKTIEEPPEYAVIMLLTENAEALLPTIRSRCVMMKLRNIKDQLVKKYLMEQMEIPDYKADVCVAFAQGNMGKAIMLATSEYFNEIKEEVVHLLRNIDEMNVSELMDAVKKCMTYKMEINDYLDMIAIWYRDVLIYKATKNVDRVVFSDQLRYIKARASKSSYEGIENILDAIEKAKARLKANVNFELTMELLLLTIRRTRYMTKVIGVRFRTAGKIYFFSPGEFEIKQGDHVIVETARGIEYGRVVSAPKEVDDDSVVQPLKSVIRIATEQDEKTVEKNRQKEKEAFKICQEKIRKHGLDMKLIEAEYTFDNNKVLFYFTADGRIDFRELVKDLAAVFRTRIELRQIGVRDETKIRGGIGICGRPLCCSTYLTEFAAVSIKMAKEQNLSLNPTKISGVCGRLMCCLTNEEETYEVLNSQLPSVGDNVTTSDGLTGTVHSLSVLRRLVKVIVNLENDEKEIREYKADDLKFRPRRKKQKVSKEEQKKLAALERMEKKEGASKLDDK